ncbi:MAG: EamA family transporter [Actinobacteria bacterium]|nr:EamA family transporter [Actinomycetota bacterium]
MIHTVALAVALVLNATANLMIRAGARGIAAKCSSEATVPIMLAMKAAIVNPWIIGGVVCFGLNLAAYSYALTKLPVSMAYPIMVSVGYAIIICGAAVWFSEKLSPLQMVGVGVILAGVWLVASGMVKTA